MTITGKTRRLVWSGPVREPVDTDAAEMCITATVTLENWDEAAQQWLRTRFTDGILVPDDPGAAEKLAAEDIWYAAESRVLGSAGLVRDDVEIVDRDS